MFVYDFIAAEFDFHNTLMNTLHAFSNDGSRLIFPVAESPEGGVETKPFRLSTSKRARPEQSTYQVDQRWTDSWRGAPMIVRLP